MRPDDETRDRAATTTRPTATPASTRRRRPRPGRGRRRAAGDAEPPDATPGDEPRRAGRAERRRPRSRRTSADEVEPGRRGEDVPELTEEPDEIEREHAEELAELDAPRPRLRRPTSRGGRRSGRGGPSRTSRRRCRRRSEPAARDRGGRDARRRRPRGGAGGGLARPPGTDRSSTRRPRRGSAAARGRPARPRSQPTGRSAEPVAAAARTAAASLPAEAALGALPGRLASDRRLDGGGDLGQPARLPDRHRQGARRQRQARAAREQLADVEGGEPQTILILGSDKRPGTHGDPGARTRRSCCASTRTRTRSRCSRFRAT